MELFRISATARSPNYLPEYLARDLGYFEDEGLDVSTVAPDSWTDALDDLHQGRADAVLGGSWLPAIYYGRGRRYRIFAQLNHRYPLALVTRTPMPADGWDWLGDRVVLVPSSGGAAAFMFFTGLLREAGFDPSRITFLRDLSHRMYGELFVGGLGDAIVTYMVNARRLVDGGHGHLATSLTAISGPMPNSVYYTTEEILDRSRSLAGRFARAVQRSIDWVGEHGVRNHRIRDLIAKEWPDDDQEQLLDIVDGFHASGLWAGGVTVDCDALARWQRMLVEGGLLDSPAPFAGLVDERPAAIATAELRR